jgi:uncharacterized membrane protein
MPKINLLDTIAFLWFVMCWGGYTYFPSRRGHHCPRPSQSRASAIHAPGSSRYRFAHEPA